MTHPHHEHPRRTARPSDRPGPARLVLAHARAQALVILRNPLSLATNTMYPTLAFCFFVLPQDAVVHDATQSLIATAQLAVFGVLTSLVFGYGIAAAEDRADPWTTYVRTLPAGAVATTAARFVVAFVAVAVSLIPLVLASALLTAAPQAFSGGGLPLWRAGAALLLVLASGIPFLALAVAIGYSTTPRTALALAQIVTFPLAFVGGLMFPPSTFPHWADAVSLATPTRAARDLAVGVLIDAPIPATTVPVFVGWSVVLLAAAVRANRRDEGRRFR